MADKVETMAHRGAMPWHGNSFDLEEIRKGGIVTVEEMVEAARLGWGVDTAPVDFRVTIDGKRSWSRDPDHFILYRTDTGAPLDIVGKRYQPFQNTDVLEFFQEYVDAGEATLETAGSLDGGRYIWGLAKLHQSFNLGNGEKDIVEGYVLLMNPHQYGKGMILKKTDVRVVCWNTLTAALKGKNPDIRLWHNRAFDKRAQEEAKTRLGIARDQFRAAEKEAQILAGTGVKEEVAIKVINRVFSGPSKAKEMTVDVEEMTPRNRRVFDLFNGEGMGSRLSTAKGTAWGLLNAATQYVDHEMGRRDQDARLMVSWLGRGEKYKRDMRDELLALAGPVSKN